MVGCYYLGLLYASLTRKPHKTKMYREFIMHETAETFRKWVNELPEKVDGKDMVVHEVWIVAALLLSMRYINDATHLPGHTTLEAERLR